MHFPSSKAFFFDTCVILRTILIPVRIYCPLGAPARRGWGGSPPWENQNFNRKNCARFVLVIYQVRAPKERARTFEDYSAITPLSNAPQVKSGPLAAESQKMPFTTQSTPATHKPTECGVWVEVQNLGENLIEDREKGGESDVGGGGDDV